MGGLPVDNQKGVTEIHRRDTDEVDLPRIYHRSVAFLMA